jgi:hypothetical protein
LAGAWGLLPWVWNVGGRVWGRFGIYLSQVKEGFSHAVGCYGMLLRPHPTLVRLAAGNCVNIGCIFCVVGNVHSGYI